MNKTDTDISEAAAAMGRKGGRSKSASKLEAVNRNLEKARKAQTPEQRSAGQQKIDPEARRERARKAAAARWAKKNP